MKKQQGLTLIELLISLTLGLFIIAATLSMYINTIKSSADTIKATRLSHDLEMAVNLMSNDIKRAGYWGNARMDANSRANPFTVASTTDLATGTNISGTDCILYTYDSNDNGTVDTSPNEYFGFRRFLNSSTGTYTIQIRTSNVACNASTGWSSITDENTVNVTDLQFSFVAMAATTSAPVYPALTGTSRCWNLTTSATPNTNNTIDCTGITNTPTPTTTDPHDIVVKRVVNIRMTGGLIGADNAEVRKSVSSTVEIRNNRLYQKTS